MWLSVLVGSLLAALGAAVGIVLGYHARRAAAHRGALALGAARVHGLVALPRRRGGGGGAGPRRVLARGDVLRGGGVVAAGAAPASGKLSCANRASVWASPSPASTRTR